MSDPGPIAPPESWRRRATRLARRVLIVLAALWLAIRVLSLYEVRRAVPDFESRWGSLAAESLTRPTPENFENAARYYEAAGRLVRHDERISALRGMLRSAPAGVTESERQVVRELGAQNELPLQLYRAGAAREKCEFLPNPVTPDENLDYLIGVLQIARIDLLLERDPASLAPTGAFDRSLKLATCFQHERPMIHQRLGQALERVLLRELLRAVEASGADDEVVRLAGKLPLQSAMPGTIESARFELLSLRPLPQYSPLQGLRHEGSIWNPLVVDGFGWAALVAGYDSALESVFSAEGRSDKRSLMLAAFQRLIVENVAPIWKETEERSRFQNALRELARFAIQVSARARETGSYDSAVAAWAPASPEAEDARKRIRVSARPDGGLTIAVPENDRPKDRWNPDPSERETVTHPWEWTLPPIAPASRR